MIGKISVLVLALMASAGILPASAESNSIEKELTFGYGLYGSRVVATGRVQRNVYSDGSIGLDAGKVLTGYITRFGIEEEACQAWQRAQSGGSLRWGGFGIRVAGVDVYTRYAGQSQCVTSGVHRMPLQGRLVPTVNGTYVSLLLPARVNYEVEEYFTLAGSQARVQGSTRIWSRGEVYLRFCYPYDSSSPTIDTGYRMYYFDSALTGHIGASIYGIGSSLRHQSNGAYFFLYGEPQWREALRPSVQTRTFGPFTQSMEF